MKNAVEFVEKNGLSLDYVQKRFNFYAYVAGGYQVMEKLRFAEYVWENGINSASVLDLIAFHIGVARENGSGSQKSKNQLYEFAKRVEKTAPKLKELIDKSLSIPQISA